MKTLKNIMMCLVLLCGAAVLMAQAPQWQWAAGSGACTAYNHYASGESIETDSQGNQYVLGTFGGMLTLGSHTLTAIDEEEHNVFIAKLDPNGNWLWAVHAGRTVQERGLDISLDGEDNVYVAGSFKDTATFGSHTLTAIGDGHFCYDMFVAKLDTDGNWLWAVQAGSQLIGAACYIASDDAGNAYMTGNVLGTISIGGQDLASTQNNDIVVAKLDPNGNWLWATIAGGSGSDGGIDIALDEAGNAYVTGTFCGTATFGSHTLTATDVHNGNVFVAKLDAEGNWLWAVQAGGSEFDTGLGIATDGEGNAYVTGIFSIAITFGNHSLVSSGSWDIFVTKLDPNGNWLWATKAGGPKLDEGADIAIDGFGNTHVTGCFTETATFGDHTLTAMGTKDIFVAILDADGNWTWAERAGWTIHDKGYGIASDTAGNVYVTGYYTWKVAFGDHLLTSNGGCDVFVAKLGNFTPVDDYVAPQVKSRLHDAWPNPFGRGTSTMIKTDIPERSTGTLSIYNLRGQRVARYELSSGSHQVSFTGDNLPAGIYFYSLQCGSFRETKKLVLLR